MFGENFSLELSWSTRFDALSSAYRPHVHENKLKRTRSAAATDRKHSLRTARVVEWTRVLKLRCNGTASAGPKNIRRQKQISSPRTVGTWASTQTFSYEHRTKWFNGYSTPSMGKQRKQLCFLFLAFMGIFDNFISCWLLVEQSNRLRVYFLQ